VHFVRQLGSSRRAQGEEHEPRSLGTTVELATFPRGAWVGTHSADSPEVCPCGRRSVRNPAHRCADVLPAICSAFAPLLLLRAAMSAAAHTPPTLSSSSSHGFAPIPHVTHTDYTTRYRCTGADDDYAIHTHGNGICVLTLSPTHPLRRLNKTIKSGTVQTRADIGWSLRLLLQQRDLVARTGIDF